MPDICENWLRFVNSWGYYAGPTHEIYQILPYSLDLKAQVGWGVEMHWVRQYLVHVICIKLRTYEKTEMTVK